MLEKIVQSDKYFLKNCNTTNFFRWVLDSFYGIFRSNHHLTANYFQVVQLTEFISYHISILNLLFSIISTRNHISIILQKIERQWGDTGYFFSLQQLEDLNVSFILAKFTTAKLMFRHWQTKYSSLSLLYIFRSLPLFT